jgi:very-short-patch-repair endonuclease
MIKYSKQNLDNTNYIQLAENYYAERSAWATLNPVQQHLELCTFISKRRDNLQFTGQSACAASDIPRTSPYELRPYCISNTKRESDIIRWNYGERDQNASMKSGLLVASPARTMCDIARCDSPESVLVSLNHCLFNNLLTKETLAGEIENRRGSSGNNLLKQLLRLATPKCESPLETIGWIALYDAGFVMPQQQIKIHDGSKFVGRVDMYWDVSGRKIVLELDGRIKLEKDSNSLALEKNREDKLREMGYEVIRANWKMVRNGELAAKVSKKKIPMRRYSAKKFPCR